MATPDGFDEHHGYLVDFVVSNVVPLYLIDFQSIPYHLTVGVIHRVGFVVEHFEHRNQHSRSLILMLEVYTKYHLLTTQMTSPNRTETAVASA